jgi:DNA polymerase-4
MDDSTREAGTGRSASILHVDLDAFYASVEQLDDPALRGKPVIVGGTGNRGVVCAASYEARVFGVHSAMPTGRARRLCPHGIYLPARFDRYGEKSRDVMAILCSVTPMVEQLSVDEAFVDASGVRRQHGDGAAVARLMRERIRTETGLTASIGVASTKFLAKVASDLSKPDGLLVVDPGTERDFLAPLPVTRLWGVGPATFRKLDRMGVATIGDVAALPQDLLVRALGAALGRHLHALAHNDDPRDVVPERAAKSIGAEETFTRDLHERDACDRELLKLAQRVTARLRDAELVTRTITLKVRFGTFETHTHSRTLARATDVSTVVLATARALLDAFDVSQGIRLLGISASQLEAADAVQGVLALDEEQTVRDRRTDRRAAAEHAADAVRRRFGDDAVGTATLAPGRRRR